MPQVIGTTEPHPSFGFFTQMEWKRLSSLSRFSQKKEIASFMSTARKRKTAYNRRLREQNA